MEGSILEKLYDKLTPFMWESFWIIVLSLICDLGLLYIRGFKSIFAYILIFIGGFWVYEYIKELYRICLDIRNNEIVEEVLYVKFIIEKEFHVLAIKNYLILKCHKVKKKKYTHETIDLKSLDLTKIHNETFVKVLYYKNSKIIYKIEQ